MRFYNRIELFHTVCNSNDRKRCTLAWMKNLNWRKRGSSWGLGCWGIQFVRTYTISKGVLVETGMGGIWEYGVRKFPTRIL